MSFAEVVVNIPIRRTFARRFDAPPPPAEIGSGPFPDAVQTQLFHYTVPPELDIELQVGHLVWVPFGRQMVQGVVVRRSHESPVPTKPIDRLARPQPVLTPLQLNLGGWIAEYYVAPLAEAVKLFLPPGLLVKAGAEKGARAKRELRVTALVEPADLRVRLVQAGRTTAQAQVLGWFLQHPAAEPTPADLAAACQLKSLSAINTLLAKDVLTRTTQGVRLNMSQEDALALLLDVRGVARYAQLMNVLHDQGVALWKSELYALADADLALLRAMEKDKFVTLQEEVRFRDPLAGRSYAKTTAPKLTSEQEHVWTQIAARAFPPHDMPAAQTSDGTMPPRGMVPHQFLLHGVTGSGKTEIYLRAIAQTLANGRQAVVLVPEIALTPQTVARFAGRFPGRVTVIHSDLSAGERYDVWRAVRDGRFDIVVGPRSALFAPLARLGLIIVDEEHESSYKQNAEEWGSFNVFYDARIIARQLAVMCDGVLLMGSATPSLESYLAAQREELTLLEMPNRVVGHRDPADADSAVVYAELPPVEMVDMRQELRAGNRSIFSRSLQSELHATLDAGEQAILFLNRRGTATFVMCRDCGVVAECPRCEIPLTYHERAKVLICHHCNRRYPIPIECPECASKRIKYFGSGTQRIEELVQQIAPRARIVRWDADAVGQKGRHEEILTAFAQHEADVMVGTQMIAKGLDLPLVTLVGVISADVGLYLPDFRSGERTFQLLTQVAGRAGRSARGGRVVVQTYTPEHYAIQAAAQHDFQAFFARELAFREEHGYPPVRRLARLIYWHRQLPKAQSESERMATVLRQRLQTMGLAGEWIGVLGPAPAFFARHRGNYRWQILLRAPDPAAVLRGLDIPFGWRVDIDPVSVL